MISEHDLQQTIDFWDAWLEQKKKANILEFMIYGGRALEACKELMNSLVANEKREPTTEELIEFLNDPDARQEQHEYAQYLFNKREKEENPPLTLEVLKQINGEPVWLYGNGDTYALVYYLGDDVIGHEEDCFAAYYFGVAESEFLDVKDYGKTWTAYRRKPEDKE